MADEKIAYASSAAMTITLSALASSSTLVAGRESTAVVNTSNLYLDYLLAGKITTGTSPTVDKQIQVYVYGQMEDTPDYPGALTGSDAAATLLAANRNSSLRLAGIMIVTATTNVQYSFGPVSVLNLFGGIVLPKRWGVWVTHDTGVNLKTEAGSDHAIWQTGIYRTVT